ncbi:MAG: eukaryotic-like serine/threonine-protein kinase [Thermoplasmata archaeon]|nr:eukaryotic-like serine/threonine-protein kinase [Thermoplasmata archaeon]
MVAFVVPVGAALALLTAVALVAFGAVLAAAGRRRADARFLLLALFMAALGLVSTPARTWMAPGPALESVLAGAGAAWVLASTYLFCFFARWPAAPAGGHRFAWPAVLGAGWVLAAWRAVPMAEAPSFLRSGLISVYVAGTLAYVLVQLGRRISERPEGPAKLLFPALWVVALPTIAQGSRQMIHGLAGADGGPIFERSTVLAASVAHLTVLLVASAIALVLVRRRPAAGRVVGATVWGVLAFQLAFKLPEVGYFTGPPPADVTVTPLLDVIVLETTCRWLAFGALVSGAVLRQGMLGVSPRARVAAARVAVGAAFAMVMVLAVAGASLAGAPAPDQAQLWLVGVALVVSQGFRNLVDRAVVLLYGPPPETRLGDPLAPGTVVESRWLIERYIGRGAAGRTFLARDDRLGRHVAIKEVPVLGSVSEAMREARLAATVRHPRVVAVHDVVAGPGATLIVAEFVPGGSLADRLAQAGKLPPEDGVRLVRGILEGLAALHAAGIVHGDLAPGNILLDDDGPKITDFGVARAGAAATRLASPGAVGTPLVMAPEQLAGGDATFRTDVFAVGALARMALSSLPRPLQRVVARAQSPDPARRFEDGGEMLAAWTAHAR